MENLYQYIENLLVQHDYVVVPNLGGFVLQKQSAKLFHGRITPPRQVISFNPLMQYADGLLAIEISRSKQMTYRQAVLAIDDFVAQLWSDLKMNGYVQLGDLGKLIYGGMNSLTFLPNTKANFLPQNFELSDLYVSTLATKERHSEKRKLTISFSSSRLYKFGAAAAIVVGLLFISPKVTDVRQAEYANLASISFVDTISHSLKVNKENDSLENLIKQRVVASSVNKNSDKLTPVVEKEFHVVVASLPTLESAEKFCWELKVDKFSEAKVLPPKRTYRVAIQSFSDKNDAVRYMENLRKTDSRFKTAWVLCK